MFYLLSSPKTLLLPVCLPPSPSRRWAIQTHLNSVDEGRRKILDKGQAAGVDLLLNGRKF